MVVSNYNKSIIIIIIVLKLYIITHTHKHNHHHHNLKTIHKHNHHHHNLKKKIIILTLSHMLHRKFFGSIIKELGLPNYNNMYMGRSLGALNKLQESPNIQQKSRQGP